MSAFEPEPFDEQSFTRWLRWIADNLNSARAASPVKGSPMTTADATTVDAPMKPDDLRWMRLEALKLARNALGADESAEFVVTHARAYTDFLIGTDRAALAAEAKAAVDRAMR